MAYALVTLRDVAELSLGTEAVKEAYYYAKSKIYLMLMLGQT